MQKFEQEVKELSHTKLNVNVKEIDVHKNLLFTMVDGEVCNALTPNQSSQKYIHSASKDLNKNETLKAKMVADPAT
jgi:hypothetical protein